MHNVTSAFLILIFYQLKASTSYRQNLKFGLIARNYTRCFSISILVQTKKKESLHWNFLLYVLNIILSVYNWFTNLDFQQLEKWCIRFKVECFLFVTRYHILSLIWHLLSMHLKEFTNFQEIHSTVEHLNAQLCIELCTILCITVS